jgi:hypothetical protein
MFRIFMLIGCQIGFCFNLAYFNAQDIKALQARFVTILEAVLKDSLSPIHTLPVMTDQERNNYWLGTTLPLIIQWIKPLWICLRNKSKKRLQI